MQVRVREFVHSHAVLHFIACKRAQVHTSNVWWNGNIVVFFYGFFSCPFPGADKKQNAFPPIPSLQASTSQLQQRPRSTPIQHNNRQHFTTVNMGALVYVFILALIGVAAAYKLGMHSRF